MLQTSSTASKTGTIAIIGASGFVGSNLIRYLVEHTRYSIRAVCPHLHKVTHDVGHPQRVTWLEGDVFHYETLKAQLQEVATAFYLVHMMNNKQEHFLVAEERAAQTFARAAKDAGVSRVIYMSGLGDDADTLSEHLRSRHHSGDIFRAQLPLVVEFRASMIIGEGSISYDIVRELVRKLPGLILPWSTKTKTQPIALPDALGYLTTAITVPLTKHEIVEIGGPEKMSYVRFIQKYAASQKKFFPILRLPMPFALSVWGLNLFTPLAHARVGEHMVGSFKNEMVVTNNRAAELFPEITPRRVEEMFV